MRSPATPPIEAADNALQLLVMLQRDGVVRVSGVARELDVARSTAHRLLSTLLARGFAVQDVHRRYLPGPALRQLAIRGRGTLSSVARPHMTALCTQTAETVSLLVRRGTRVRFLESIEPSNVLRVGARTGVTFPAERTSGGKVLLAELSDDEMSQLYAGREISDLRDIREQLSATRRRGYGINVQETEVGVVAFAVAVRDSDAVATAALAVSVPTVRYRPSRVPELVAALRATAERIRVES